MATYTGTADASGNFNISFGGNSYVGAQKVTVTAAKDGGSKTVELFAPADLTGGGVIRFSGNMTSFPNNIGVITLGSEIAGALPAYCFGASSTTSMYAQATGLIIAGAVTSIGNYCFQGWAKATSITFPASSLTSIGAYAFNNCTKLESINIPNSVTTLNDSSFKNCTSALTINTGNGVQTIPVSCFQDATACTSLTIGTAVNNIQSGSLTNLTSCNEMIVKPTTPPALNANAIQFLKSTCVIKVPAASLSAYQNATNWSAHASKMVGV